MFEKELFAYGHKLFQKEHHRLVEFIVETDGV